MSDGTIPSVAFRTCTAIHSRPLAEWMVEIVSQSSSIVGLPARSDVDRGGSKAKSAATSERRELFAAPATRESKSTSRTLESG
jgi:hypothetical protein